MKGVVSRPKPGKDGYMRVQIGVKYSVNRLVAVAFLPPPAPDATQIRHKDRNPRNNQADNLQWVTPLEIVNDAFESQGERASSAQRQSKPVLGRKLGEEEWTQYESMSEVERQLGINISGVSECANGKRRRTAGYEFKFAEPIASHLGVPTPDEEWRALTPAMLEWARAGDGAGV